MTTSQGSQTHLPVLRLVTLAYADVWRAFRAMPILFGCAVLIMLAFRVAEEWLRPWNDRGLIVVELRNIAENAAQYFCLTPIMIAIHRFIIRGDVMRGYLVDLKDPSFLPFFGWAMMISIAMTLVFTFYELLLTIGQTPLAAFVPFAAVLIAVIYCWLRLLILFPALAVGAAEARPANAFADTQGFVVRLLATVVLTFIPLMILGVLITLALGRRILAFSPLFILSDVLGAIISTITTATLVVVASHIYIALARKLRSA
jgi:hypothetical protein